MIMINCGTLVTNCLVIAFVTVRVSRISSQSHWGIDETRSTWSIPCSIHNNDHDAFNLSCSLDWNDNIIDLLSGRDIMDFLRCWLESLVDVYPGQSGTYSHTSKVLGSCGTSWTHRRTSICNYGPSTKVLWGQYISSFVRTSSIITLITDLLVNISHEHYLGTDRTTPGAWDPFRGIVRQYQSLMHWCMIQLSMQLSSKDGFGIRHS